MAGFEPVEIDGRTFEAYVPDKIARWNLDLAPATIRATERAAAEVARASELSLRFEGVARLLLRREGLSSSAIEGLQASAGDVARAEADPSIGGTPGWVASNLALLAASVAHRGPLTKEDLLRWHRQLMEHSTLPRELIGEWRDRPGWVGGQGPRDAAFIPPAPKRISSAMTDLLRFANRTDLDPVTHAAVLHAQFETIHPFADGNGRIGRVLIGWSLVRLAHVAVPPPVSLAFVRDVGGYLSGLTMWRSDLQDRWINWLAGAVSVAANVAGDIGADVEALATRWDAAVADLRTDAAARRLVGALVDHPVVTASTVARLLDVSDQSAASALRALADRGIVTPVAPATAGRPGRPAQWYEATDITALIGT